MAKTTLTLGTEIEENSIDAFMKDFPYTGVKSLSIIETPRGHKIEANIVIADDECFMTSESLLPIIRKFQRQET